MSIFIIFSLVFFIALLYILEVILGSSIGIYDSAIGYESNFEKNRKLLKKNGLTQPAVSELEINRDLLGWVSA